MMSISRQTLRDAVHTLWYMYSDNYRISIHSIVLDDPNGFQDMSSTRGNLGTEHTSRADTVVTAKFLVLVQFVDKWLASSQR